MIKDFFIKIVLVSLTIFFSTNLLFCQLIPNDEATFQNVENWSRTDDQLFVELKVAKKAITNVKISATGIHSFVRIESTFTGGKTLMQVESVQEIPHDDGKMSYIVDLMDYMHDSRTAWLFEYSSEGKILAISYLVDKADIIKFR